MKIMYRLIVINGKVVEEQYFENVCCDNMKKSLLNQEMPFAKENTSLWLYCPFCKKEIEY